MEVHIMRNAYFQLIIDESGTWVKLIPEEDGGESLNFSELKEYLELRRIPYDTDALYEVSSALTEEKKVRLCRERRKIERESYRFSLEENGVKAVVRFYAPAQGGELLGKAEVIGDLRQRGMVAKLDEGAIDSFFKDRSYCTSYVVAQGRKPRETVDSRVEYFFNTDRKAKPAVNPDGSVDFFHLNAFNSCLAGDKLARVVPPVVGEPGEDVMGRPIPVKDAKMCRIRFGRNITLRREDGLDTIYSDVNGHVSLVGGEVFVSNVLEVENVDTSTGNIEYEGSVQVNGNVCSNFSVHAKGDVDVHGVVEGANVEAGGNIVIVRGMNGMGKGVLKAGGNVVAKYLESANVEAKGDITCNSIMQSTILCSGEVTVNGRKGFIAGGKVCATKRVVVKNLGSPMGVDTIVEVGTDPKTKQRFQNLHKKIREAERVVRSLDPILKTFDDKIKRGVRLKEEEMKYLASLLRLRKMKNLEIDSANVELEPLKGELKGEKDAYVLVSGSVHHGTKVSIGDVSMIVHDSLRACKFVYSQGDVKAVGID